MKKIMIPLANGFEEIEAITNIDDLRKERIEVVTVSINEKFEVKGDHGIFIKADEKITNINPDELSGVVLPGGMPGAANLRDNEDLIKNIKKVNNDKGLLAAICAAPIVLEKAGIIKNKQATSYPGFGEEMSSCNYSQDKVVRDDNIITGRGPGVAMDFAMEIVSYLLDTDTSQELKANMIFDK